MAHHNCVKYNSYNKLSSRINLFPQGAVQVMFSHRALAALLGVILKLPPVKQAVASQQFKSRYLTSLIRRHLRG